jgi:hypothetical protein
MLRTLGIPARLAVGFTPGTFAGSAERLTVTTDNAHSWVEVLFPSFGWVPFEPTPNRQNLAAYPYLDPDSATPCVNPDGTPCQAIPGRGAAAGGRGPETAANSAFFREGSFRPEAVAGGIAGSAGLVGGAANAAPRTGLPSAGNALLAAIVATAAGLALVPPVHAWRRRRRLRRAGPTPRGIILATYDVFEERAAELGHPRSPGQTLEEYRCAVGASGSVYDGDLDRLTGLATDAAYAANPLVPRGGACDAPKRGLVAAAHGALPQAVRTRDPTRFP